MTIYEKIQVLIAVITLSTLVGFFFKFGMHVAEMLIDKLLLAWRINKYFGELEKKSRKG